MDISSKVPDQIRSSYTRKFAVMALVIVLVVVAVGFTTQASVSDRVTDQQRETVETNAELEAKALGQWLTGQKDQIRVLSSHRGLDTDDPTATQETLEAELDRMPESTAALHFVDRENERIITSTNESLDGQPLNATNIWWNPEVGFTFENSADVIESFVYADNGEPSVALASPTANGEAAVVAVIRTNVHAERFSSSIEDTNTLVMGGSTGLVLFDNNKSNVLTSYGGEQNTTLENRVVYGDGQDNGTLLTGDHVVGYTTVPGTDWIVVKEAPKSAALAVRDDVQGDIAVLIGITLLGFVAIGLITRHGPMRALNDLSSQATAIAEGDLSVEIEYGDRIDEVGQVQSAFVETKSYLDGIARKAEALSNQDFDDPVFEEDTPGRLGDALEEMRTDLEQFVTEIETAREEAEQSRREAEQLASELESQADEIGDAVDAAADGDLTQQLSTDTDAEAMAEIADGFNHLLGDLESTFGHIRAFANEVDESSAEIDTSAAEITEASQDVSNSVQRISDQANEQNETIQQVIDEMTTLSATIEEIASSAEEVATQSSEAVDVGEDGVERAEQTIEEMDAIEAQSSAVIEEVEELESEMEEISEIVSLINEIAEQTNMLALNASIEAARAGEAGEGFAVVADEIKGLAQETESATQEIEALIDGVQETTSGTVRDVREMDEHITDGRDAVRTTVESLERIVKQVEEANDGIQSINDATDEQAASTEEVVSMVERVGESSQETVEIAENVSAAAEEQASAITQISNRIEQLSTEAAQLREYIAQFEIDETIETDATAAGSTADD